MLLTLPVGFAGAAIDLKNVTFKLRDGFANGVYSPTVSGTAAQGASLVNLTTGTMGVSVPVGAHCYFAGDLTKYRVTARTVNAGVDEVQSLAANTATGGTFDITFTLPSGNSGATVDVTLIDYDETSANIQTAVDTAFAGQYISGTLYTAGDIAVTGGPASTTPVVFTFSGASAAKHQWPQTTIDDTNLTGGSGGAFTTTTEGAAAGATDSISITPTLAAALSGGEAITFAGIELTMEVGEGNMTYDITRNIELLRDRGVLDTARLGDEEGVEVEFSFTWKFIKALPNATTPSIEDFLFREGAAAAYTSAGIGDCDPYAVTIVLENKPTCKLTSGELDEEIVFPAFYYTSLNHDAEAGTVTCSGICNVTKPTVTRKDLSGSSP
jgi:hypothetical protein